jgi:uncharacterized protein YebE (UPF0316 family)
MSLDYAYEKLFVAVTSMATSTDSLQNRLANAYIYGFHTIGLDVNADLPPNLRSLYREIEKNLTKVPAQGNEGSVVATTRAMRDEEAKKLIEQIVHLYDEVAQLIGRESKE